MSEQVIAVLAAIVFLLLTIILVQSRFNRSEVEAAEKNAKWWMERYRSADRQADAMFERARAYKERLRRATERVSDGARYEKCGTGCASQPARCGFSQECASE